MKRRHKLIIAVPVLLVTYLLVPIVAGCFAIGDRDGPIMYPKTFHTDLYIIGYEGRFDETPREGMTWLLYGRPLFYGLNRRPKSREKRASVVARFVTRYPDSQWTKMIIEENERIEKKLTISSR